MRCQLPPDPPPANICQRPHASILAAPHLQQKGQIHLLVVSRQSVMFYFHLGSLMTRYHAAENLSMPRWKLDGKEQQTEIWQTNTDAALTPWQKQQQPEQQLQLFRPKTLWSLLGTNLRRRKMNHSRDPFFVGEILKISFLYSFSLLESSREVRIVGESNIK